MNTVIKRDLHVGECLNFIITEYSELYDMYSHSKIMQCYGFICNAGIFVQVKNPGLGPVSLHSFDN